MTDKVRRLRTYSLCLIALAGILYLAHEHGWGAIETAVAVATPLGAWIGGKAWASAPDVVRAWRQS